MDAPRLFDSPAAPPTTRTIALTVQRDGSAALDQAQRRADNARYQEVTCRSALNPVKGMPFQWTLNPYRGCTHACHYCFARRYQTQFSLGPGRRVLVAHLREAQLSRGAASRARRSRRGSASSSLSARRPTRISQSRATTSSRGGRSKRCWPRGRRSGLVTKGPMVVRDADLLAELGRHARCTVHISVPTVDEEAWAALEPGTAHPLQRLRAVRALRKAGVNAGVLMAPIVPGLHHRAPPPRSDDPRGRRARCRVHGRQRAPSEGRHEGSLHGIPAEGIPPPGRRIRAAVSGLRTRRRTTCRRSRGSSTTCGGDTPSARGRSRTADDEPSRSRAGRAATPRRSRSSNGAGRLRASPRATAAPRRSRFAVADGRRERCGPRSIAG